MNMNNNEQGSKLPLKPLVMPNKSPYMRTVSAQATITENVSSTENKETPKLNTNAPAFVPKEKRSETTTTTPSAPIQKVEKDTTVPTTTTTTTQMGMNPTYTNMNIPNFPGQGKKINLKYLGGPKTFQPSYIPYTYLNTQVPMGYQGFTPSPNRMQGGFFNPNTMPIAPMGYQAFQQPYAPNIMPKFQMTSGTPGYPSTNLTPNVTNVSQNPTTTTTTTTNPLTTSGDKKMIFNKESKVFIPKALRTAQETANKEEKTEKEETSNETKQVKSEEKVEVPRIDQAEVADGQTKQGESVKEETQTEQKAGEEATSKDEPKKVEKKSKLSDLLESGANKPATAPKIVTGNKKIVVTQTLAPPKLNDVQKSFEEKRKQLFNQQKQQTSTKPTVTPSKKGITKYLILEREVTKEEREQVPQAKADSPIPSDEEDVTEEVQEESKPSVTVNNFYFLQEENKTIPKNTFSVDYLLSFRNWKICGEQKLLDELLKTHLQKMNTFEDERPKNYKGDRNKRRDNAGDRDRDRDRDGKFGRSTITPSSSTSETNFSRSSIKVDSSVSLQGDAGNLSKWGRKDMSEAERIAAETKAKLEEYRKLDPVKNELTEMLNILTVDNYEEVKHNIFEQIKGDVEDQKKFLEVLFKKAVSEKAFVGLYAKICKDLDRDMPQKSDKDSRHSKLRSYLVDKCREIFKVDNSKVDQYIKVSDPDEREAKLKKFLLGNVNFIAELINSKLLSKKIVFQCIGNLFTRAEKEEEQGIIKLINIEGIVILMDKFGTLINRSDSKMKAEEFNEFNKKINDYLDRLDDMQANDSSIPGHIKYKIINLIEKGKRGWEESKVDKASTAKGMKEVREEYENEQRTGRGPSKLDQEVVNGKIREDLYSFKDFVKTGGAPENYNWKVTETLTQKYKNTVGEILTAFGENCIDFVGKQEDIGFAYSYIREIVCYYSKEVDRRDKTEIIDVTLFFLQNLNDFSLDNNMLVDVWGGVVYLLDYCKIFSFVDLDKLKDVQEDQLKTIFEVINQALTYGDNREEKLKEILNVNLVKNNKSTFQSIVEP